jgi:hypothetical protein
VQGVITFLAVIAISAAATAIFFLILATRARD